MQVPPSQAPGAPGIAPRWTTSSKDGIGSSINAANALRFTLSHGILNEVYFPREDLAAIRDLGLIVTDGAEFFSEEKRDTETTTEQVSPGIPAFVLTNRCRRGHYRIVKEIVTDPLRNTVLQRIAFQPTDTGTSYHLYALLAPHLANLGMGNTAWVGDYKGRPMLFARHGTLTLALACSVPWLRRSAGFVGISDGWQDLSLHREMQWEYACAEDGNVALTGEIDLSRAPDNTFDLALGFGESEFEAAHHAVSSLVEGFEKVKRKYVKEWQRWQDGLVPVHATEEEPGGMFRLSAQILHTHQSKRFPGAMIASLSIPWGNTRGDGDRSGYHVVWPRDLVESAGGLLALNAQADVRRVLNYLVVTQEEDGHWSQNMWVEGSPYWEGLQLDETSLPILLIDRCLQEGVIGDNELPVYWAAIRKAVTFLLRHGIVTGQERWEEQRGVSVFTMATLVPAMLAAAEVADRMHEPAIATYCRQTADAWNESIDYWLYSGPTPTGERAGVGGYYLRINPTTFPAADLGDTTMQIKNKPDGQQHMPITEMVSIDPLALVRFGLRSATDPRILNTVKVIDGLLRADTPNGTAWYRYVNDGYGEHEDGSAYDGTGIGRPWPLLAAERAHYELAATNSDRARELLRAVEAFSNYGLLSEQIWDQAPIPEYGLVPGKHSGSAMPLVWAHAEHIKLVCSLKAGKVVDLPRHSFARYVEKSTPAEHLIWRSELPVTRLPAGKVLRIETAQPARVRWTIDGWTSMRETETADMGLGLHFADLPTADLAGGTVTFTLFWKGSEQWANQNFSLLVQKTAAQMAAAAVMESHPTQ